MLPASTKNARPSSGFRRFARVLALATALLLLCVAGLFAANLLLQKPPPAPLWTEQDLPAIPDPASNGWAVIQAHAAAHKLPPLPTALSSICNITPTRSADVAWSDLRTQQPVVSGFVTDPDHAAWYRAIDDAMSKPLFADGCPVRIDSDCSHIVVLRSHQMMELSVLHDALGGHWDEAFADAIAMTSEDAAYARSTRGLVATMIALRRSSRVVDLVDVLLAGVRAAGPERSALPGETARRLEAAVSSLTERDLDLQRAVIGEYVLGLDSLALVTSSPGAASGSVAGLGPVARLMFDRGDTLRMINDEFRPLAAYARAPSGPVPPPPAPKAVGPTWWMHNAVGKSLLDTASLDLARLLKKAADERAALLIHRDAVQAGIAALSSRPSEVK